MLFFNQNMFTEQTCNDMFRGGIWWKGGSGRLSENVETSINQQKANTTLKQNQIQIRNMLLFFYVKLTRHTLLSTRSTSFLLRLDGFAKNWNGPFSDRGKMLRLREAPRAVISYILPLKFGDGSGVFKDRRVWSKRKKWKLQLQELVKFTVLLYYLILSI